MYLDCTFMPSKDDRTLFADLIYTLQYNKSQFRSKSKIEKKNHQHNVSKILSEPRLFTAYKPLRQVSVSNAE